MSMTLTFDEAADDACRTVIGALCELHLVVDVGFHDSSRVSGVLDRTSDQEIMIETWDPAIATTTGVVMSYRLMDIEMIHVW